MKHIYQATKYIVFILLITLSPMVATNNIHTLHDKKPPKHKSDKSSSTPKESVDNHTNSQKTKDKLKEVMRNLRVEKFKSLNTPPTNQEEIQTEEDKKKSQACKPTVDQLKKVWAKQYRTLNDLQAKHKSSTLLANQVLRDVMQKRNKQIKKETEQIKKETEQIKKETEEIRKRRKKDKEEFEKQIIERRERSLRYIIESSEQCSKIREEGMKYIMEVNEQCSKIREEGTKYIIETNEHIAKIREDDLKYTIQRNKYKFFMTTSAVLLVGSVCCAIKMASGRS